MVVREEIVRPKISLYKSEDSEPNNSKTSTLKVTWKFGTKQRFPKYTQIQFSWVWARRSSKILLQTDENSDN